MNHEIDLTKYKIRTDLAVEVFENKKNKEFISYNVNGVDITKINIDSNNCNEYKKKKGNYITLGFKDISDFENRKVVINLVSEELKKILKINKISEKSKCLVVGLGNSNSTPDSLGPLVLNDVLVTRHLYELNLDVDNRFSNVSKIAPGVMGQTGVESFDIVKSVVEKIKPDFMIIIDSLASKKISRVNKTIQITDSGINPGSGIGNNRKEFCYESFNIPVIAIGVPTVVDAVTIVADSINYIFEHFSYYFDNVNDPLNKLIPKSKINIENKKYKRLNNNDKKNIFGMIGGLNDSEIRKMLFEVLTPRGYNFMATFKDIDFEIENLSKVIATSINNVLHNIDFNN